MTTRTIPLARSRSGQPALWEAGGGMTNTGNATVIAGPNGEPLAPIYVNRRGSLACGQHALLPVDVGCYVIDAEHHRGDFNIVVRRITALRDDEAEVEIVATYERGEWDSPLLRLEGADAADWWGASGAAVDKAQAYHCRGPFFVAAE